VVRGEAFQPAIASSLNLLSDSPRLPLAHHTPPSLSLAASPEGYDDGKQRWLYAASEQLTTIGMHSLFASARSVQHAGASIRGVDSVFPRLFPLRHPSLHPAPCDRDVGPSPPEHAHWPGSRIASKCGRHRHGWGVGQSRVLTGPQSLPPRRRSCGRDQRSLRIGVSKCTTHVSASRCSASAKR